MNPNLIKRSLDDAEYSNACPTIGTLLVAHYSTPAKHREDIYSADSLFFSTYPDRRIYLRPAVPNEFDIDEAANRPMLWVRVMWMAPGFHEILPVWRGSAFWNEPDSDFKVGKLCYAFALREGMNLAEWMGWIQNQRIRNAPASIRRKRRTIH